MIAQSQLDAFRLRVDAGPFAGPALSRLGGIAAARSGLTADDVACVQALLSQLAAEAASELAEGQSIELIALPAEGRLELSVGVLRAGGAANLIERAAGLMAPLHAAHVLPVEIGDAERVAIEIARARPVDQTGTVRVTAAADVPRFHVQGGATVATVHGEIDLASGPVIRLAVRNVVLAGAQRVVLDLTSSTFLDSSGIGMLIGLAKLIEPQGHLAIASTDSATGRALNMTGLSALFTVRETVDDAVAALPASL